MMTNSSMPSRANWYSCDGCRASCSGSRGNTMAQGTSVGRPHNSWPIKFPSLPSARPTGTNGATKSIRAPNTMLWRRANRYMANSTPRKPPWNDMPPCHTRNNQEGSCASFSRAVKHCVTDPAAEDNAKRGVEDQVVNLFPAHHRPGTPGAAYRQPPRERRDPPGRSVRTSGPLAAPGQGRPGLFQDRAAWLHISK